MNTPLTSTRHATGRFASIYRALGLFLLVASVAVVGCGDDPVQPSPNFEARGIALRINNTDTVVVDSTNLTGSLYLLAGTTTETLNVQFIKKDGTRTLPQGNDYSLGWTVADTSILAIQPVTGAPWQFRVQGKKKGSTTVVFKLMKGATAVYTSRQIPATVDPAGLSTGDTLTYAFYDRDAESNRIDITERRKTWYVLRTGITYQTRANVTEILEVTTDIGGTIEAGRDTIYLQMNADGRVMQYDALRKIMERIEGGEVLNDALQPDWIRIGDIGTEGSTSWPSLGVDSLQINNVQLAQGIPAMNLSFRMDAAHQGRTSVTVPAGTYTDAYRTDHRMRMLARLVAPPLPVIYDSLMIQFDISRKDAIIRQALDSRLLQASLLGQTQDFPVTGYEMVLISYKRAE